MILAGDTFAATPAGYLTGIFAVPMLLGMLALVRFGFRTMRSVERLELQRANDNTAAAVLSGRVDALQASVTHLSESFAVMRDRMERGSYPNSSAQRVPAPPRAAPR